MPVFRPRPLAPYLSQVSLAAAWGINLLAGLVAYYKCDESSGNASDATGNGNTLTDNGGVGTAAGEVLTARSFNGTTQFLSGTLAQPSTFTVAGWIYLSSLPSDNTLLAGWTGDPTAATSQYSGVLGVTPAGHAIGYIYDGAPESATGSVTIPTGAWHHLAMVVIGGSQLRLYVDGVADGTASIGAPFSSWFAGPYLHVGGITSGGTPGFSSYLAGRADEIGMWSRALSAAEVALLATGLPYSSFGTGGAAANTTALAAAAVSPTTALVVANTPPANTLALAAASSTASTSLAVTNTPPANTTALAAAAVSPAVALAVTGTLGAALAASASASTVAFAVTNTPPPNTSVLGAASASSTVSLVVSNTMATTLAGAAQSSAAALSVVNTPPPNTLALAAAAQSASTALVVSNTMASTLGAASVASTVAFAVLETPPANTTALAASATTAAVALSVVNAAPGTPVTMAAASSVASAAFAASTVPPARTAVLGAASGSSSTAFAALNVAPGDPSALAASAAPAAVALSVTVGAQPITGVLGAASGASSVALAVSATIPAIVATLGAAAQSASTAFAVATVGGTGNTVSLRPAAGASTVDFRIVTAPVENPNLKQAVVAAIKASPEIQGIVGTRVYPDGPPATAQLPSLCYSYVWAYHVSNLAGAAGMVEYRLRFECRSLVQADNEALALYVRLLFQGKIGDVSGLRVQFVNSEHEMDKYIPPLPGSDNGTHWKRFDMRFKVREAVPFTLG